MKRIIVIGVIVGGVILAGGSLVGGSDIFTATTTRNATTPTGEASLVSSREALATVTLRVGNLYCVTCPLIVRQTLERAEGVVKADVSFRTKTAVVSYDPAKCDVNALIAATNGIGFPSEVMKR